MSTDTARRVLLVLASWTPDAPAGIERATAALAIGLAQAGHHPVIATAAPQLTGPGLPGVSVERLRLTGLTFPCDDETLCRAVTRQDNALTEQIRGLTIRHRIDTVLFTDALWGLGRLRGDLPAHTRRVLAAHVPPAKLDAGPALARAGPVIVPSTVVSEQLTDWGPLNVAVVPNALLPDPGVTPPDAERREELRRHGPVRVLARLGPEKGVAELLEAVTGLGRRRASPNSSKLSPAGTGRWRWRSPPPGSRTRRVPRPRYWTAAAPWPPVTRTCGCAARSPGTRCCRGSPVPPP
ncbi:hypothetical protein ASC99_33680 [Kitasatospora sp. Root107]|nr:hypothetical protein ASC99_33680 [Kitasatospora sp. Root107]